MTKKEVAKKVSPKKVSRTKKGASKKTASRTEAKEIVNQTEQPSLSTHEREKPRLKNKTRYFL